MSLVCDWSISVYRSGAFRVTVAVNLLSLLNERTSPAPNTYAALDVTGRGIARQSAEDGGGALASMRFCYISCSGPDLALCNTVALEHCC